jgi:translocation protein SEC63
LTITGVVTLPLTYSLFRRSTDNDALAPRISSDYKTKHGDVVTSLRAAQKRKQRKIKRAIFAILGWALMAGMVYLIVVTKTIIPKLWNPYDILGISDVSKATGGKFGTKNQAMHPSLQCALELTMI